MRSCAYKCKKEEVECPNEGCRLWINYEEDLNCTLISVDKHGSMTLRDIAKREGVSFVRIQQIEKKATAKLKKKLMEWKL
tara:strand:- start:313 stop:552 length:240 start_codon:yes stop_codon:yes gene_type:complete